MYTDRILYGEYFSGLSDSELSQVASAIQKEQNARKSKKRKELINKVVVALHDLQDEYFDDGIMVFCDDCGGEMWLTLDEIAEKIKYEIE